MLVREVLLTLALEVLATLARVVQHIKDLGGLRTMAQEGQNMMVLEDLLIEVQEVLVMTGLEALHTQALEVLATRDQVGEARVPLCVVNVDNFLVC
jgi:hypothetical protein